MVKIGPKLEKKQESLRTYTDTITILNVFSTALGNNKLYLISNAPYFLVIVFHFYTLCLISYAIWTFVVMTVELLTIPMHCTIAEYVVIATLNFFYIKTPYKHFFQTLKEVDEKFQALLMNEFRVWSLVILATNFCHHFFFWCWIFLNFDLEVTLMVTGATLVSLSHDQEYLYTTNVLRMIEIRLCLLKAHLHKRVKHMRNHQGKMEELAMKCDLNTQELHQVYRSLYHGAELIQNHMCYPITVEIIITFINTNIIICSIVERVQDVDLFSAFLYITTVKSILLLFIPGSICSRSTEHVENILFLLADILTDRTLDKEDRRRLKVFHQECREKQFRYWLCRVIPLDIALPAKFINLCITCLVIGIQFKKLDLSKQ